MVNTKLYDILKEKVDNIVNDKDLQCFHEELNNIHMYNILSLAPYDADESKRILFYRHGTEEQCNKFLDKYVDCLTYLMDYFGATDEDVVEKGDNGAGGLLRTVYENDLGDALNLQFYANILEGGEDDDEAPNETFSVFAFKVIEKLHDSETEKITLFQLNPNQLRVALQRNNLEDEFHTFLLVGVNMLSDSMKEYIDYIIYKMKPSLEINNRYVMTEPYLGTPKENA